MLKSTTEQDQLAEKLALIYVRYELDVELSKLEPIRTIADVFCMYKEAYDEFWGEIVDP